MVSTQAIGPAFVDSGFAIARRSTMAANARSGDRNISG